MKTNIRSRFIAAALLVATGMIASTLTAPQASAHEVALSNRLGGTLTLSDHTVVAGKSLTLLGTGFTAAPGTGTTGSAVLVVKVNGAQNTPGVFPWSLTGASAIKVSDLSAVGGTGGFAPIAVGTDGTFAASLGVPTNAAAGKYTLTFLGGSASTGTRKLAPQSFSTTVTVTAAPKPPVVQPPAPKPAVIVVSKHVTLKGAVKGTAKVGKKLTATKPVLRTTGVTVKRQWLRNGKAIAKATKSSYKLLKADRKKKVSLRVTYSKAGHTTLVRTTAKVTVR